MTILPETSMSGAKDEVNTLPTPKSLDKTIDGPPLTSPSETFGNFHNLTDFSPIALVTNNSGKKLLISNDEIPAS
ncbi:hypothetical protein WICMUC_004610 [Wickerhamomyces mucosus]|uniref:Uncharacterized protein n=1 Tax=Wickerhamomyces mucosus TaxID=1378264 RepID=A0A9P8PGX1_9ASCO|nr:hypothetical protein WICMUC_004610 [Wickerhamomyces mucosus]